MFRYRNRYLNDGQLYEMTGIGVQHNVVSKAPLLSIWIMSLVFNEDFVNHTMVNSTWPPFLDRNILVI